MLCIRPFAKINENESKVEFKGISKISRLVELFLQSFKKMENEVYKVLSEWNLGGPSPVKGEWIANRSLAS